MKTFLLSENLQKKLMFVNHGISSRSQLPIILNFLLEAKEGSLRIYSTDLEIGIMVEIPAKTEEEGRTTVSAKTFTELIGTTPLEKITLEKKGTELLLTGEKTKTSFQTTPPEEFPKLYEEKGEKIITLDKKMIEEDFPKVVFAASTDIDRPALSGMLIKEEKEGFLLVATDGYRLSLKKNALQKTRREKTKETAAIIVPSRVIRELVQMGKDTEDGGVEMYMAREKNQVIFSKSDAFVVGRLIDAEFPPFEKIIPTDFSIRTEFEKQDMQRAVKAGYVFARQTAGIVRLSVKKDRMVISANAPSVGTNTIEIDAKTTGEENEIAFNARYLLDFLSNTTSELLSFEMTGPLNPGVFKEAEDDSFIHLIMPIRVQQE